MDDGQKVGVRNERSAISVISPLKPPSVDSPPLRSTIPLTRFEPARAPDDQSVWADGERDTASESLCESQQALHVVHRDAETSTMVYEAG